jgi:hypothetical protein
MRKQQPMGIMAARQLNSHPLPQSDSHRCENLWVTSSWLEAVPEAGS